jgi:hypothetical protein
MVTGRKIDLACSNRRCDILVEAEDGDQHQISRTSRDVGGERGESAETGGELPTPATDVLFPLCRYTAQYLFKSLTVKIKSL